MYVKCVVFLSMILIGACRRERVLVHNAEVGVVYEDTMVECEAE